LIFRLGVGIQQIFVHDIGHLAQEVVLFIKNGKAQNSEGDKQDRGQGEDNFQNKALVDKAQHRVHRLC